ncbi:MAG TPA: FHA domain-containing protein, partial [Blastocatellia bacterium]|nr:FHA domain-containing protein [Blastocatellia bacterium]
DLTFPHDVYLSGRHARVIERDGRYFLVDQNSRNGTFIRISKEVELKPGDIFLVGKQVFRFNKT